MTNKIDSIRVQVTVPHYYNEFGGSKSVYLDAEVGQTIGEILTQNQRYIESELGLEQGELAKLVSGGLPPAHS